MNSYLYISVCGKSINRFLRRCIENDIDIYSIKYISYKEILIKIKYEDYKKILKIKSLYKINIIDYSGFIKIKKIIRKNIILIIMFFVGIIFLTTLTNMIFNINIISNNNDLVKKIKNELKIYDIKKYSFKKKYDEIQKIKEEILNKYKDNIEWIEITDIGTTYEIRIVERKKNQIIKDGKYANIVAKKSGVVRKIYATSGEKNIELNTYVNKGDILIRGSIIKGEDVKQYVKASGKVYAEVWYNVTIEFPLKYSENIYTNESTKSFYIKLNDKYIEKNKYKNYERESILSIKNRLLPFEVGIEKIQKVKIINDIYTYDEALKKAKEKIREKVLQTLDKDEYIMDEKVLNFTKKDSKIVLDMFVSCFEEISKEEEIVIEEQKEQ